MSEREQIIKKASEFDSTGCRYCSKVSRCQHCMTDFAIQQVNLAVKAAREQIASELIDLNRQNPDDFLAHLSYYVQELAGRSSTAHRMLDDLKKGEFETLAKPILPTIEEMSGLVDDFTNGVPLKEYLEQLSDA